MTDLEKITSYLKENYHIDEATDYTLATIDGFHLLVPERLDLISKLKYIEMKDKKLDYDFPVQLYKAHLEAFSNGTYEEPGNDAKKSFEDYENVFNQLIEDIKKTGMDSKKSLIPVGKNGAILDGAHRTAISIYYRHKLPIIQFSGIEACYDSYYFKDRLLDSKYIDYMVLEYAKYKKNVFCFCFWPKAKEELKEKAFQMLKDKTKIIHDKKVFLTYNGYKNLMQQIYHRHDWVGSYLDKHKGVLAKVDSCYEADKSMHLVVVEGNDLKEILDIKEQIRDLFKTGKSSIHSTDTQEETIEMLQLLLNENSIHMMNYGNPDKFNAFNEKIEVFKKQVESQHKNIDDFIIDSSSVLSLYGLREAEDIDYISIDPDCQKIDTPIISNHCQYLNYYQKSAPDLVLNPDHFLIYNGIKFITLDVLKQMKERRKEKKDLDDIRLIRTINDNCMYRYYLKQKLAFKRFYRNTKLKTKKMMVKFLKTTGLYSPIKKMIMKRKAGRNEQ